MEVRDILKDLFEKKIFEDQADKILDDVLDESVSEVCLTLGLSRCEWTAYAHGATLNDLSLWRYEGWPDICVNCGDIIQISNFGWTVMEISGVARLRHIVCPKAK